jgi:hypothetical protein
MNRPVIAKLSVAVLILFSGLIVQGSASVNDSPDFSGIPQTGGEVATPVPSYPTASVPARCEVQAAKERLWAHRYFNPDSAWSSVQAAKERLWAQRYSCPQCYWQVENAQADWSRMMWERGKYATQSRLDQEKLWSCLDCCFPRWIINP